MQSMMNQILFVFRKALLQFVKSISFSWPIEKNAKPQSSHDGFVVFKPKSRCDVCVQFASFWLKYNVSGLK